MTARRTFQGRQGALRILDGSTPPNYLEIPYEQMNLQISGIARPRPTDPIKQTIGGYAHLPDESYEAGFYEPTPFSFSCWVDEQTNSWKLRDALCNADMDSPWKVGTTTWTSASRGGSITVADGTFIATQAFYDTKKVLVNMESVWTDPSAGSAVGIKMSECYFPPQEHGLQESTETVELTIRGLCYGTISQVGAFSTGNAS